MVDERRIIPKDVISYKDSVGLRGLTRGEMDWIELGMSIDLRGGLKPDPNPGSLKMIDTHLPTASHEMMMRHVGEETLVLALGGTNVEATWIYIDKNGEPQVMRDQHSDKPLYTSSPMSKKEYSSPEELFSEMLSRVDGIVAGRTIRNVAFIFTFPGEVMKTEHGIDVLSPDDQTKGIKFHGISAGPIGESLISFMRSTHRYDLREFKSLVTLNDTPAVLLADVRAKLGGIVGTGYNLALLLYGIIYNLECGGFLGVPMYELARMIDEKNREKFDQLSEKQISGLYLGKTFELAIGDLKRMGAVDLSVIPRPPEEEERSLPAKALSHVLRGTPEDVLALKQNYLEGHVEEAMPTLRSIAEPLRDRAAQHVGTHISAAVNTFPDQFPGTVVVPIAGSIFGLMPGFRAKVQEVVQERTGKEFDFPELEFPEAKGATVAVMSVNG